MKSETLRVGVRGAYPIIATGVRLGPLVLGLALSAAISLAHAESPLPPDDPARELALLMRTLDRTARVLYVTAHPDDEDAGLLARLVHGEGVETMLLTVTRGEGGQNEIGTELFDALGVLRSRELEAAGRHTGVRQAFTRAFEFGYSFSVEETLDKWGHDAVLRDIVRVVRTFRPDVILTLPHLGEGGGQHHQATARLAAEAFTRAAEEEWPHLGPPHRTARLFRQIWRDDEHVERHCNMELGIYDPILGASYEEMGVASRAAHKCQGMARYSDPLPSRLSRWEWRLSSDESPTALTHVLDHLDEPLIEDAGGVTPFGAELTGAVARARDAHALDGGDELAAELSAIHALVVAALETMGADPDARVRLETLRVRVARALLLASGVRLAARADRRHVAPGDTLVVTLEAHNTGGKPVMIRAEPGGRGMGSCEVVRLDRSGAVGGGGRMAMTGDRDLLRLEPGGFARARFALIVRADAEPTLPVPVPRHGEDVDDETAQRWLEPAWRAFELHATLERSGTRVTLPPIPISCQELDATFPSIFYSDPHIVPDPSVRFERAVVPVPTASGEAVEATVSLLVSSQHGGAVRVDLDLPDTWALASGTPVVETPPGGVEVPLRMALAMPRGAGPADVRAGASYAAGGGGTSTRGYRPVAYRHIRPTALLVDATARVRPFACALPDPVRLGYVEGAGDRVLEAIGALGIEPVLLSREDLLEGDLSRVDVIMTGVRAYKVRDDLASAHGRLMSWVREGGTMIVQYNKLELNAGEEESPYAPYPGAAVGRRRVTVEEAPVRLTSPDHALFHAPNRIGPADWEGWVQERGLYFLDVTDSRYQDLLTIEDPWPYNAGEQGGALVVAPVGRGRWVYVGLGLFRQLPAGVPGAYRLLANLVALGSP